MATCHSPGYLSVIFPDSIDDLIQSSCDPYGNRSRRCSARSHGCSIWVWAENMSWEVLCRELPVYVISWLFTISDPLWMMMEKNLRLSLKWQMGWSREFRLSSNMRLLIAAIDTLYPSHVESHRTQRRLKLWFVTPTWWTRQGTFVNDCIMPPRMLCDDRKPLGELDANSEVKILCSQEAPWSQDLGLTSLFYWESPSLCRHSVNR